MGAIIYSTGGIMIDDGRIRILGSGSAMPLWSKEGKDLTKASRKAVPIEEQYTLNLEFVKQFNKK